MLNTNKIVMRLIVGMSNARCAVTHSTRNEDMMITFILKWVRRIALTGIVLLVPLTANAGLFSNLIDSIKELLPQSSGDAISTRPSDESEGKSPEDMPTIVTPLIGKAALALTVDEMRSTIDAYTNNQPQTSDETYAETRISLPTTFGGCAVPKTDASGFKQVLSKSQGLLMPVFKAEFSESEEQKNKRQNHWDSLIDWPATEKTYNLLKSNAKLNLAPLSETRKVWRLMAKYLENTITDDSEAYYKIAESGGGGLGQLWGAAAKSDIYRFINDPNVRLSGYVRSNYFSDVLSAAGSNVAYIVTVNEPKAIINYFFELRPRVRSKLDPESVALNLQKDVTGVIDTSMFSSLDYYYGLIDDKRAGESSLQAMVAGSFVKIRLHTKGLPEEEVKARESLRNLVYLLERLLLVTRSNLVSSLTISMMDKYKNISKSGIDMSRVLCGSLDKKLALEQAELEERLVFHRSMLIKASGIEGALTMYTLIGEYRHNPDLLHEVGILSKRALNLYKKVIGSSDGSVVFAAGSVIPRGVTELGLSGYISSERLK